MYSDYDVGNFYEENFEFVGVLGFFFVFYNYCRYLVLNYYIIYYVLQCNCQIKVYFVKCFYYL